MRSLILSMLVMAGVKATAEGYCYMPRSGQTVSIQQFFDLASDTARSQDRCVTAATSSSQVGAKQFDRAGSELDSASRGGCLMMFCNMTRAGVEEEVEVMQVAAASGRRFLCRCYGEPGHRFAGELHVEARNSVEAAQKADIKCKAQAWGMYGTFKYSLDTCI